MDIGRRHLIGGLAFGAGAVAASQVRAAEGDGHADGEIASPSSAYVRTIPRQILAAKLGLMEAELALLSPAPGAFVRTSAASGPGGAP